MKYLYIYNYQDEEKDLCCMEFRRIFQKEMTSKYFFSSINFDYTRSVFIRGKLDILCSFDDFNEIVSFVKKQNYCFYNFKVIYLKNEITHVPYKETLQMCKAIALPISGSVNMQNPDVELAITKIENTYYFGIYHHDSVWNKHFDKPYSYSHSLNLRVARSVVNIAIGNEMDLKVVDPCCGIGTVVLEALSMGVCIRGYDINRYVSYQARLNLEYFGYDPLVIEKKDMRFLNKHFDVAIIDIPYGVYSPFTHEQQLELLKSLASLTDYFVLISHVNMFEDLENLGYHLIDHSKITKGQFDRYITYGKV